MAIFLVGGLSLTRGAWGGQKGGGVDFIDERMCAVRRLFSPTREGLGVSVFISSAVEVEHVSHQTKKHGGQKVRMRKL